MLTFGQVTGRFLASVTDNSSDLDATPDVVPLTGYITFTPSIKALQTEVGGSPVTVVPTAMTYNLDAEGYLVHEGVRSIPLIATDNLDDRPYNWTWKVDFALSLNGRPVNHAPFSIKVPSDTPLDLAYAMPLNSSTGTVTSITPTRGSRWWINGVEYAEYTDVQGQVVGDVFLYSATKEMYSYTSDGWTYAGTLG